MTAPVITVEGGRVILTDDLGFTLRFAPHPDCPWDVSTGRWQAASVTPTDLRRLADHLEAVADGRYPNAPEAHA